MNEWIQLSPYGTFDHPSGKQVISLKDGKRCVKGTETWMFRLKLKKIPVYIGHPDDPLFQTLPEHMNTTVYGYVTAMRYDNTGIWVKIRWTEAGQELIENGVYTYLSPRWLSEKSVDNGYHPIKLLSVGLTQHPNLPVKPILESTPMPSRDLREVQERDKKIAILHFSQKINERMQKTGESYPEAWQFTYNENKNAY